MSENQQTDDVLAAMAAELDVPIHDYEPEVGEQVVGYVDSIDYMNVGENKDEVPVVMLNVAGGSKVRVFCGRARLRKELARQLVQPGDAVGIKYEGMPVGKSYHSYRITVHRIGERQPELAFRNPEPADDLGLSDGTADDKPNNPWNNTTGQTEAGF